MSQHYSNPARESEPTALPDVEVFQLTAHEVAATMEDECAEAAKRFPLAAMNSRDREKALDWIVSEYEVQGGWFWHRCFPGCLPDSEPTGPFTTRADALADAQSFNDHMPTETEFTFEKRNETITTAAANYKEALAALIFQTGSEAAAAEYIYTGDARPVN